MKVIQLTDWEFNTVYNAVHLLDLEIEKLVNVNYIALGCEIQADCEKILLNYKDMPELMDKLHAYKEKFEKDGDY